MAKTAKPASDFPVTAGAGNPYQLEADLNRNPVSELRTMEPERLAPKAAHSRPSPVEGAKEATGRDLYDWLVGPESGTNPDKLRGARDWLQDNPTATCADFLHMLEDPPEGIPATAHGTLRKAGKWVFGPLWEPETAVQQAPGEEIARLRGQVNTLEDQIRGMNAQRGHLESRIRFLDQENKRLTGEVDYLRTGKTQQELAVLGIGQDALALAQ